MGKGWKAVEIFLSRFRAFVPAVIAALCLLYIDNHVHADEEATMRLARERLVLSKPYNCDSLVDDVKDTSEDRMNLNGYSIVQILDRKTVAQSPREVRCEGTGVRSDSHEVAIDYGAYIDAEGAWMLSYSVSE
jgi:hypothetical protein